MKPTISYTIHTGEKLSLTFNNVAEMFCRLKYLYDDEVNTRVMAPTDSGSVRRNYNAEARAILAYLVDFFAPSDIRKKILEAICEHGENLVDIDKPTIEPNDPAPQALCNEIMALVYALRERPKVKFSTTKGGDKDGRNTDHQGCA